MNLTGLLVLLQQTVHYRRLLEGLRASGGDGSDRAGEQGLGLRILEAARPYLIAALQQDWPAPLLVISPRPEKAVQFHRQLRHWSAEPENVLLFPEPDALPFERTAWHSETKQRRLTVLSKLTEVREQLLSETEHQAARQRRLVIVASAQALLHMTLPYEEFARRRETVHRGQVISMQELVSLWYSLGYQPVSLVEGPGTFSRHGGILDIYPPNSPLPTRLEFFGDQIESLRLFDPVSQRSQHKVESLSILPASEALPFWGKEAAARLRSLDLSRCQTQTQQQLQKDLETLQDGEHFREIEHYIPYLYREAGLLFDYLPPQGLVVVDSWADVEAAVADLEELILTTGQELTERGELPPDFLSPYLTWDNLRERLEDREQLVLGSSPPELPIYRWEDLFVPEDRYGGQLRRVMESCQGMMQEGRRVVVVTRQALRLAELLAEQGIHISPVEDVPEAPPPGGFVLVQGTLPEGWKLQAGGKEALMTEADSSFPATLSLLTDAEIFGWIKPEPPRPRPRRAIPHEAFFADLSPGDYVVHIEHGIALFQGLTRLTLDEVERDYLLLEYAAGDKLYVPVYHADRVSRYVGVGDRPPVIHRLGAADWGTVKARARRAVEEIAEELLELYSAREVVEGHAFAPDTPWQRELEASFPYVETEDQLLAIEQVKEDMEERKPMDRLICGDVGYGKTEVALRAAFKAVMDDKQAAVLVPTTILAQQHFQTFEERLRPFPVVVEMLSRFRTTREQKEILRGMREGTVDIVIGTHRLLQKDVAFRDLGLLIIDEEQRFGVTHKEKFKQMRKEVDVLTLTATPIPRTLHMSLMGVRDMSTIDTPPEERLPVRTIVTEYDEDLMRQAILRELSRGGQVYFVHNRVRGIRPMAQRLSRIVPEASLAIAHGRMRERDLERVMLDFARGHYDVLVCTSIIESGIDIPNVNTLIVNRADQFGLADLYQLRGRVGRSAQRAYAYFFYSKYYLLSDVARRRLQTIAEASELGAGFQIAMRDLEIRGAGELLGARQHGHIAAIGFDLYCRLLARAVRTLKEREGLVESEEDSAALPPATLMPPVTIDLPLEAYLPPDYIPDEGLRLRLYRRVADIATLAAVDEFTRELSDRFGQVPDPVRNMLYMLRLKLLAIKGEVEAISVEDGRRVVIKMRGITPEKRKALAAGDGHLRIGHNQVWLPLDRREQIWRRELEQVLKAIAG
ncbi:MAG: transcription-repair coupling factor [Anaerolineae bacterium]